jgi:isopenicillin N synthase-like dioxygenase
MSLGLSASVTPIFPINLNFLHFSSETVREYCKRSQEVASELVRGISESLGLEERYIEKTYDLEVGSQLLVVNLYPPCPEPEVAIGLPPHTDHGILTLLMQNELPGLQVMHNGKWVPVNDPPPNSFLVNVGDHMEVYIYMHLRGSINI